MPEVYISLPWLPDAWQSYVESALTTTLLRRRALSLRRPSLHVYAFFCGVPRPWALPEKAYLVIVQVLQLGRVLNVEESTMFRH